MLPLKLCLSAGLIMLAWPAWLDTMRVAGQHPPVELATLAQTRFEHLTAEMEVSGSRTVPGSPAAQAVAREAAQDQLRVEPLTSLAIPFAAPAGSFDDPAGLLMAERVTRRDPQVQLQLAAEGAKRGDLPRSLFHLDRALKVSPELSARIFPSLASAAIDKNFTKAVRLYNDRPWFWQLAKTVASVPGGVNSPSQWFAELTGDIKKAPDDVLPVILHRLLADGRALSARSVALASGKITNAALNEFTPNADNSNRALFPLTWKLGSSDAVAVSLGPHQGWSAIIEPGRTGALLERVTLLAPGRYHAEMSFSGDGDLSMRVSCYGVNGNSLAQAFGKRGLLQAEFTVVAGCSAVFWSISGSAPDSVVPAEVSSGESMRIWPIVKPKDVL